MLRSLYNGSTSAGEESEMGVLPDGVVMDQDNDASITTAVSMAPVTSTRRPFVQAEDDERLPQAGRLDLLPIPCSCCLLWHRASGADI
jgi:hypothetical protein